jgi:uncharacterized protein YbjT (DUF2867 family)
MSTLKAEKQLKVLVYGGTGSQAAPTVWTLLERGHKPYVLSRDGQKAQKMKQAGAEIVIGDTSDKESLIKASKGMDAIALMTPFFTNVLPGVTAANAIEAAQAAGVPFIVWNTGGKAPAEKIGNPLLDHQYETVERLKKSGLKYIILQPTVYLENLLGPYTAPFVSKENKLAYPHPAGMKVHWIASQDVGKLVVAALERPELSGSRFEIAGTERLDGPGLAAQFSAGLGREISYYAMPPAQFAAILNEAFGPGAGDAVAKDYQLLYDQPEQQQKYLVDTGLFLNKLPIRMTPVKEWLQQFQQVFS